MNSETLSAKNQMAFQERMSSTAHTREVQDLKNAGLNPVLSAGGQGASTPSGAEGDTSSGTDSEIFKLLESSVTTTGKALSNLSSTLSDIVGSGSGSGKGSGKGSGSGSPPSNPGVTPNSVGSTVSQLLPLILAYTDTGTGTPSYSSKQALSYLTDSYDSWKKKSGVDDSYKGAVSIPGLSKVFPKGSAILSVYNGLSKLVNKDLVKGMKNSLAYTFSGQQRKDLDAARASAAKAGKQLVHTQSGFKVVSKPKNTIKSTAKKLVSNFKSNFRKSVKASFRR